VSGVEKRAWAGVGVGVTREVGEKGFDREPSAGSRSRSCSCSRAKGAGQEVRGRVSDDESGEPVPEAVVALLDAAGRERVRGTADADGAFRPRGGGLAELERRRLDPTRAGGLRYLITRPGTGGSACVARLFIDGVLAGQTTLTTADAILALLAAN
jgi:hypothetical protein